MQRLDWLRISLLASLTGCSTDPGGGESEGHTNTTSTGEGTETSSPETCELGCEGAIELAEGVVQCPDGKINRMGGGTFDPTITAPTCMGTETFINCMSDADCMGGAYGKCISTLSGDDSPTCDCAYACASDDDCSAGFGCLPSGVFGPGWPGWPTCQPMGCATGSDCGECGECGVGRFIDGCEAVRTAQCRTASDACSSDADCEVGHECYPDSNGTWVCQNSECAIGRPLLVDAVAGKAPLRQRADWASIPSGIESLREDPELAAHWAEVAALEHASVASFARFGAQLLALGAPPELLRASKRAALDEIEHARLAYGLASAYGGTAVGPGQLSLRGVSTSASWREVVAGLIEEACVGETLGVAEAMVAAESARVPAVRRVLARIVADELRHAQLAWRSLAWLLRAHPDVDDADRAWAQALLERSIRAVAGASGSIHGPHRPADGVLGGLARAQVHHEASEQVLGPLALALCVRAPTA
jgi:hypothetical protein